MGEFARLDRRALIEDRRPGPGRLPGSSVAGVLVDYLAIASAIRTGALLGRAVHHFQLLPLALSLVSFAYSFVQWHFFVSVPQRPFWRLRGLVFMAKTDLAASWSGISFNRHVACDRYALHAACFGVDFVWQVCSVRKRWRFTGREKLPAFDSGGGAKAVSVIMPVSAKVASAVLGVRLAGPAEGDPRRDDSGHCHVEEVALPRGLCLVQLLPDDLLACSGWLAVVRGAGSSFVALTTIIAD